MLYAMYIYIYASHPSQFRCFLASSEAWTMMESTSDASTASEPEIRKVYLFEPQPIRASLRGKMMDEPVMNRGTSG